MRHARPIIGLRHTDVVTLAKVVPGDDLYELRLQTQDLVPPVNQKCIGKKKPIFVIRIGGVMGEEPGRNT